MKKVKYDQICERSKLDIHFECHIKFTYVVLESKVNQAY